MEQGYRCAASDTSFALLAEVWHVAVSSVHQRCHTLVVNFRCTSGTLPVWVLTSLEGLHLGHHGFDSLEVPSSAEEGSLPDRLVGSELSPDTYLQ